VSLKQAALATQRETNASRHFVIVRSPQKNIPLTTATVLLKESAFTDEEVERVEVFARHLSLELLYTPRTHPPNDLTHLVTTPDPTVI
jgi:hypothetical protein